VSVSVDQAFELFSILSKKYGLLSKVEYYPECFGNKLFQVKRDGARLRLVWDGENEHLKLEISHGLSAQEQFFWLDLYETECADGVLPETEDKDISFQGAVEYGLELMHTNNSDLAFN
jgi:hypothetical protein